MPDRSLQIAIVHRSAETRNTLHSAVAQLGHVVCFHARDGSEFLEQARDRRPDLVIVQEFLPDMTGSQSVQQIAGDTTISVVVVIDQHNGRLPNQPVSSNVMAILQEPVRACDVLPIIPLLMQHCERLRSLRDSIALLREAIGDGPEHH